jgi:DNA excision repair protein ERCC-2
VPAPFEASQLAVQVASHISTRYRHRGVAGAHRRPDRAQYARQPGNYLAFFSSYDYLQQA